MAFPTFPQRSTTRCFSFSHVDGFLEALGLKNVILVGVSIGATIALSIGAQNDARVAKIVAINPYDYDKGRGMARSALMAKAIVASVSVPLLGGFMMRMRNRIVMQQIFEGGVSTPASLPRALIDEMYAVGNRRGPYRAFLSLLKNAASWERVAEQYHKIQIPVRLVWGSEDWSNQRERDADRLKIGDPDVITVAGGGHFLPLDKPDAMLSAIREFE